MSLFCTKAGKLLTKNESLERILWIFDRYCRIVREGKEKRPPGRWSFVFTFTRFDTDMYYFLKKSGIFIDCSFTLLVGVLGASNDGLVPPTGLLGAAVVPPPFVGAMPRSSLGVA